jgi:histidine ammonia-lyase
VPHAWRIKRRFRIYGHKVFKTEINSVTDNPNISIVTKSFQEGIFTDSLALALDFMSIALAEL